MAKKPPHHPPEPGAYAPPTSRSWCATRHARAYYNEIDRYCCDWLSNLMDVGHIMPGRIDDRSIADVAPDDVAGFTRVHFFAGIAGWELALQIAGWPEDRPMWTGSCPCQPFSTAGKRRGHDDSRHLWPELHRLVGECRPAIVFGEQVASPLGRAWLAALRDDLERVGYAVGAADLPAAGVAAPHIRQRLWWVAGRLGDAAHPGIEPERGFPAGLREPESAGGAGRLADGLRERSERTESTTRARVGLRGNALAEDGSARVADADGGDASAEGLQRGGEHGVEPQDDNAGSRVDDADQSQPRTQGGRSAYVQGDSRSASYWHDAVYLPCADGKARPTQPGLFPLAYGLPGRVGRLRAYGNAIVPQVAAAFIAAAAGALTSPVVSASS